MAEQQAPGMKPGFNAPPAPPAPPSKSKAAWIGVAILVLVVVAAIASISNAMGAKDRLDAVRESSRSNDALVDDTEGDLTCIDVPASIAASTEAGAALESSVVYIERYDTDGAADQLDQASDATAEAASYVHGYPSVSSPLLSASGNYAASADALRAGDISGATRYMQSATGDTNRATSALKSVASTVVPC